MNNLISTVGHIFKTQKGVCVGGALLTAMDTSKITRIKIKKGSLEVEKNVLDIETSSSIADRVNVFFLVDELGQEYTDAKVYI